MAAEELLSLKWNNHQSHFVDILTFLRKKEMFIDATIACGGKVYSAHKFVLSTCSDYFKQIFTRNPSTNPIVYMKDVSCHDIEALLDFMYNGEVNVPQSSLGSLIKTAEGLQIKGLAVPDDPPASRREQDRDKRERDSSTSSYLENRSPPPKRRIRERISPHRRNSNSVQHHQQQQQHTPSHNNRLSAAPPVETSLDDDEVNNRNGSPISAVDDGDLKTGSNATNSRRHSVAEPEEGQEDRGHEPGAEDNSTTAPVVNRTNNAIAEHGGPGTSGTIHSKQEDMEIKQEDVVELDEDDDAGEWGGGGMGDDGGGGGNDSLSSADNTVNFSDVLLPHNDGGSAMGGSANVGDSAMRDGSCSTSSTYLHQHHLSGGTLLNESDYPSPQPHSSDGFRTTYTAMPPSSSGSSRSQGNPLFDTAHSTKSASTIAHFLESEYQVSEALKAPSTLSDVPSSWNQQQNVLSSSIFGTDLLAGAGPSGAADNAFDQATALLGGGRSSYDGNLYDTMKRTHACHICHKAFKLRHHLVEHLVIHNDEKPFKCPVCPFRTKRAKQVKYHVRLKHPEIDVSNLVLQPSLEE